MTDWQDYAYRVIIAITAGTLLPLLSFADFSLPAAILMWVVNLIIVGEDYVLAKNYPQQQNKNLNGLTVIYMCFLVCLSVVTVLIGRHRLPLLIYPIILWLIAVLDIVWCLAYLELNNKSKDIKARFLLEFVSG